MNCGQFEVKTGHTDFKFTRFHNICTLYLIFFLFWGWKKSLSTPHIILEDYPIHIDTMGMKGPLTLWWVSAYFSDASQNFPMHKLSLVSFWIGRFMYKKRIKVIIRQADPYNKTGDASKGGRGRKIWPPKHLEINDFHVEGYHIINTP